MKLGRILIALMAATAMALVSAGGPGLVHPASAQSADSEFQTVVTIPDAPVAAQGSSPTATVTPTATSPPIPTPVPTAPSDVTDDEAESDFLFYEVYGNPPPGVGVDTLESRLVGIDFGLLSGAIESPVSPKDHVTGNPSEPQTLSLNLFDDIVFTGLVEHVEPTASGHALWGRLDGVELGTMTLVVNGSIVVGTVRTPNAVYTIRTAGDGTYVIRQIDESSLPPLGEPSKRPPGPDLAPRSGGDPRSDDTGPRDDGSEIDVMVVYTPAAKHREGGRAAIEALIDLYVAETNQAYANSGAVQRIRLVHREEVNYTEHYDRDLDRLIGVSDGYMDHVHVLRDQYAADLVHLVTVTGNYCGVAFSDTVGDASEGFAITVSSCGAMTFAHELGHNMGLRHDRHTEGGGRGSNFGYVNQRMFDEGAPESARWRTIMAYSNQCGEVGGFYCPWIANFSNPKVIHNGDPMGVPVDHPSTGVDGPADAVGTLNETRKVVANYRKRSTVPAPRVGLALSPYWLSENGGVSTVTATLHRSSRAYTVITVSASPANAVSLSENRTLTIPAGQTTSVGAVSITGVDNGNRTGEVGVTVSASVVNASSEGVVPPAPVALAVVDDETTPVVTLSLSPTEVVEGEAPAFVTATLDNRSRAETTVIVSASPAELVGVFGGDEEEYEGGPTLIIPAGQTSASGWPLEIQGRDDGVLTGARNRVIVSGTAENAHGVTGPESVTLTVIDDEAPIFADDSTAYTFTAGVASSRFLEARHGNGPLTYSISPAPGNGVTFEAGPPARIGISAASAAADPASYTITAVDADGDTDMMTITITVRSPVCPGSAAVSGAATGGLVADCEALLSAHDALTGSAALNWSADTHISAWEGVEVGRRPMRVVGLELDYPNQLRGTIPSELGSLTNLRWLNLANSQLSGAIPPELGSLTNLEYLALWDNELTGEIPAELGSLTNLQSLGLGGNRLTGEIPAELGRLTNLEGLYLAYNELSGPIPAELGSLVNLQWLELQSNGITDRIPAELGGLVNLRSLQLHRNQLTGPIPASLGGLTNLEQLYLRGNRLSGCIPGTLNNVDDDDLGTLGLLFCGDHACVSGGAVTDAGNPELVSDCDTLLTARDTLAGTAALNWSADTPIAEWDGVSLGGTPLRVKGLKLSGHGLSGEIPAELGSLSELGTLLLQDNQLSGLIPAELGGLIRLERLFLSGNPLIGCIPDGLRGIRENDLDGLGLSFCGDHVCVGAGAVTDAGNPGLMSDCEALLAARDILAGAASLNWEADTPITQWDGVTVGGTPQRVTELSLYERGLTGEIPSELGNLSNLKSLNLSSNRLTGEIPKELGELSNLL
ncbi:MAG: M12 family metallo-peptidase, partial [Chloroflexota bacterium]|nr:M12 family metallo-peptidase [Chloroflexota bacterium]